MSKHSPGPWGAGAALSSDAYHIRYISDAEGNQVAEVSSGFSHVHPDIFDQDTALANADLIEAAPELLAALEGILQIADRQTDEFDAARAAVAKAKGAK